MTMKLLELCHVAPPQGFKPPSDSLPLTSFDLLWVAFPISTQRVFLYHIPSLSTSTFLSTELPKLKHSLSLTLKRFYPLTGRITGHNTKHPTLLYSSDDSVALTIAESNANLGELTSHKPKNAASLRSLVPDLELSLSSPSDAPVLALQATLFPDQGIVIGITTLHAAVDGNTTLHFMRTWASLCKSTRCEEDLPSLDRSVILQRYDDLRDVYFSMTERSREMSRSETSVAGEENLDLVRSTFPITKAELENLRSWVESKVEANGYNNSKRRFSSFTLAAAVVWTCLQKARFRPRNREIDGLLFPVDCRVRLDSSIPRGYFGNCLTFSMVEMDRSRLVDEDGVVVASVAISEEIGLLGERELLKKKVEVLEDGERLGRLKLLTVAGSPRVGSYKVDFGWGRPNKIEVVSIDRTGAMSVSENGDEENGGLEIGLALPPEIMKGFADQFSSAISKCVVDP